MGEQRKSDRRDLFLLKFIFSRQKDAVLVPRLLGLVRRPLGSRPGLLKVGSGLLKVGLLMVGSLTRRRTFGSIIRMLGATKLA